MSTAKTNNKICSIQDQDKKIIKNQDPNIHNIQNNIKNKENPFN